MDQTHNWKSKTLIIGAVAGTLIGLLAAYIFIQQAEKAEQKPQLSAGDGVKVGLGVLGVMKLISDLGTRKQM